MKRIVIIAIFFLFAVYANGQEIRKVKITELERIVAESKTPLIVNFWATWCMPCIEEIPYFLEEAKLHEKDSVKLLLVSLDFEDQYPKVLTNFVQKRKYSAPVLWLDETNADYFLPKVDPKWSGAIPATLFINNKTGYRKFFEKQLSHEELKKEIMAIL